MNAPDIKTALPGPKAKAIIEKDAKFVSPSYTRDYPFVIARGEGAVVEDVDGNRFLDCAAGIAVNSTGVSHPDVVRAIVEQAQKFIHMSGTDFYYEPQVRLAEELAAIVPIAGNVRTFFGNSGTEATEASLKLSRYYTKRQGIIAFIGEQIFPHLIAPDEVGAIVVEPVQGEGGYIVPPTAFFHGLRELASEHG